MNNFINPRKQNVVEDACREVIGPLLKSISIDLDKLGVKHGTTTVNLLATAAVTEATSRITKAGFGKSADGKITVHVHIGGVIMMGFDEAIDAEEWGMRENNTEIIGVSTKGKKASAADPEAQSDLNKKH